MYNKNKPVQSKTHCFIPTDEFHIIPLRDIKKSAIKKAVECTAKDREDINVCTLQNCLAKKLGFRGGFAGLKRELPKLEQFKADHNLKELSDLVTATKIAPMIRLSHSQIADRIFKSNEPVPKRIFTGYNVDWASINFEYGARSPNPNISQQTDDIREIEEWLEQHRGQIAGFTHLLGNLLISTSDNPADEQLNLVECIFRPGWEQDRIIREKRICFRTAEMFRQWICQLDKGWVNILQFNDNLVFLSDGNGTYDFVIRDHRNHTFNHNIHEPYLKNADIPKSDDEYHFLRWQYFNYRGWLERDTFEAEISFYSAGGNGINYPGLQEVLRRHFLSTEQYNCPTTPMRRDSSFEAEGFYSVQMDDRKLWVSNLVTIGQFNEFIAENPEYIKYSPIPLEERSTVNSDRDEQLPASVTWYDANAYATWVNKKKHLPVRLLQLSEFKKLAPNADLPIQQHEIQEFFSWDNRNELMWHLPDGTPMGKGLDQHHNKNMQLHYVVDKLKWEKHPAGMNFLVSLQFGEWLMKSTGCAINTATHSAMQYPLVTAERDPFCPHSTGRCKMLKIGFRLCCSYS